ncbi:hypothetical protein Nepgr_026379 [Nepenthes gracilis]|uniref:Uncharacterized protein n=1 Tax=Nepenthes gracilis TaxID=150966 RepID=A0AAD3T8H8_NEPGR|nr:hypothetical protein Nepgr_026379 [Nepenthes gracilis]
MIVRVRRSSDGGGFMRISELAGAERCGSLGMLIGRLMTKQTVESWGRVVSKWRDMRRRATVQFFGCLRT